MPKLFRFSESDNTNSIKFDGTFRIGAAEINSLVNTDRVGAAVCPSSVFIRALPIPRRSLKTDAQRTALLIALIPPRNSGKSF